MASSTHAKYDESRWPIVIVKTPPHVVDAATFHEECKRAFGYYERGEAFALIYDVRESPPLPAEQRRIVAEFTDRYSAQYPNVRMVTAIVVASAVQRGVVKAINWLTRQPVPVGVVGTVDEAITWCQHALAAPPRKRAAP
jgi:hypothetical protein